MRRPRGTRDLIGEELASIRYVERLMREVFKRYGYLEIETPIFENLELFTKKSGERVVKQLYSFRDKSGRDLALRPELTAPAVRVYVERFRSDPKPVKVFYLGPCFRYEEPQAHRWRQFLQAGVEIMGSSRPEADAEVLALTDSVFQTLGLDDRELRVGNVRLLRAVLSEMGVVGESQNKILRAVDSRDFGRLEEELRGVEGAETLKKLIGVRGGPESIGKAREIVGGVEGAMEAFENLEEIVELARCSGVSNLRVDFSIARGLEYYTDMVFEVYVRGIQLAGGGRYDELVESLGGEPCPAVGVGFGVDRIARLVLERGGTPEEGVECIVLPATSEGVEECARLARKMRDSGLRVEMDLMGRTLRKALAYADSRGVRYVVIIGPREREEGKVTLRDMDSGEQIRIPETELIETLKEKLKNGNPSARKFPSS